MNVALNALPAIAFARNELDAIVTSTDYLAAAAAQSVNFLKFTGAVANGTVYNLDWNAIGGIAMTAAAAPDDTGNQFPLGDGSWAYVQGLVAYFQQNFFIDQYYTVTADNSVPGAPKLVFTALEDGPDQDFTDTNAGASGVTTPGVTDQPKENFEHHVEIFIQPADTGKYEQAFTANIPLDYPYTGKTTIDIHGILDSYFDRAFDRPVLSADFALCPNTVLPYFVKYTQDFGAAPAVQKMKRSGISWVAKGGLGARPSLIRSIVPEFTTAGHPELTRFMRQGSINKLVTKEQPEWLYYINLTGAEQTVTPVVTVFNTDASSFTFNLDLADATSVTLDPNEKVQFRVGYNQLGIDGRAAAGKIPQYYTVQLKVGDVAASNTYAFILDNYYRPWPRYIVYENSYGAYQTLATVGKGQPEYDRQADNAQRSVSRNVSILEGDQVDYNIYIQEKRTVNVGYDRAGKRNSELIRDLERSEDIYEYDPINNDLIPIVLDDKSQKDAADGVNRYANSINYHYKYLEDTWTEDPLKVSDDSIELLLIKAGFPLNVVSAPGTYFYVKAGDPSVGVDGDGNFTVTDPRLVGKTGYTVYATQLPAVILPPNITYNLLAGSFTVLIPAFAIVANYPLIVFTSNINVL